jgi:hypothetical protein
LLGGLGDLRRFQDRLLEASHSSLNVTLFPGIGGHRGQVDGLTGLARTYRRLNRLADAAVCFERVLGLCRGLGSDREAKAMLFFAKVRPQ